MGFKPPQGDNITLPVQRLNHSVTLSEHNQTSGEKNKTNKIVKHVALLQIEELFCSKH